LVAKLRGAGFELQAAQIYELRTPLALARATTRIEPADHRAPALAAEYAPWLPRGAVAAFPATRLQRGMFLHSVLDGAHVFHDVLSYTVDHAIEENAFRAAVAQVVAANPVLRGSFLLDGPPEPLLVIHQHAKVDCEFVDLREIGAGDHADWLARWAAVERNAPLDWSAPGLLRFFVHRVSDGESVLSLSVHHAILDGWSVAMLVTELFIAYDRIRNDRPPGKKADHDILRRYAQLERAAERDRGHREFWREYLDGAKPSELPRDEGPGDSPAPAIGLRAVIPTDISQPLRRLARSAGVPLKTVYLAAHVASMAFLSGAPDVTAGLITNGRVEDEGGDRALGLFLNTVPLRVQLRDQTWPRLLKDVFANESLISRHRRFPFDRIQTDSHIAKLCPTAFNYTAFYVYRELDAIGLRPRDARYYEETDFPLLVNVDGDPFDETVTVTVNYKPHLVATRQAEFYLAVYTQLLEQAAAAPPEPIESAKPIESVAKSLAEWARTRRQTAEIEPGPAVRHVESVLTLVTAQIRRRPRDIAVEIAADEDTRRWTFEDLARRASRVRAGLRLASVEPNSRIACFTESGADALVALLGTWAAGGSYVPIDSGLPRARQRALLDAVPCSAVLRSPGIPADLVPSDGPELVLTAAEPPTVADVGTWPAPPPGSEAYVLFTSGSTGEPKAVSMSHGALANLIEWQIAQPEFAAPRRLSQLAPLSFDVSIQEMLAAAAAGGTLVIGRGLRRDPEATLAFLAERQIEICFLPPVLLHQLASAWEAPRITPAALRYVITAGEALVVTDAIRALCAAAGAEIINQYGPTETHVVTSHRLGPRPEAWPDRPPIGRPINNVKVVILDTFGRRVPTAVSGELHIGGPAVARGYVDARGIHPMTAERFQKLAGDDIFYRTGDLVRVGHGVLEFAGRTDEQVKIRGYRVEPGEVAAVLSRHPGVRDCLVRAVESGRHGSVLAAYVVPTDARTTADQLVLHARATLPDYMLPQHIELLERFPTTPSGKVDVRALRPPRRPRPRPGTLTSATATERRVLAAWSHVLGYRVSSPNVSFFDAGGNSLLLLSLYLNLRQSFDQEFLMHDLFRFPTARSFAGFLDTDHSASSRREDPRLDAVSLSAEANRRRLARMRGRRDYARD
jgi:amino acid adenylation domain-containing protein